MATKKELRKVKRGPAAPSSSSVGRTKKMASPHCEECQVPNAPLNWWMFCEHNPYVNVTEVPVREPIVEDDPEVPGQRIVTGERTKLVYKDTANFTQVPIGQRHDGGQAYRIALECGFKPVEEFGYAPFCEFRDCWSQDLKVNTSQYGSYCSEEHAKLVIADVNEILLDVTDPRRRAAQMQSIAV